MYIPKTVMVVVALLAGVWFLLDPAAQSAADSGVVTSWDGRQIRGEVVAYHSWGIDFEREDGFTVQVPWKAMSEGDAAKFRRLGRGAREDAETRGGGEGKDGETRRGGEGEKEGWFWRWLQR
jgi:hypothetical protein